jgi:2-oxoisovalerate dehydrogenase E1 component
MQSNASARHAVSPGNVRLQLNSALEELLRDDPRVVMLGEDLHDPYGGAFKVTANLSTRFPERVISTPISEAGVAGAAIGLALEGYLPVVEVMFADFVTLSMDQIFNHAVKFPGMFPDSRVPLVMRTPAGGRRGYGPTHSQSPENLLLAVPGLTVVFPSHRHAVGGILKNAVLCWPNPTVFFEHKLLYSETAEPGEYRRLPDHPNDIGLELFPTLAWGGESPDITLVAYGGILPIVEQLRDELTAEELAVEIVAPSLLAPLPRHQLYAHLASREAVVVIEEGYAESGFGAMLGSILMEGGFRGRFGRVHPPPVPIPAARSLETRVLPGRDAILERVLALLRG